MGAPARRYIITVRKRSTKRRPVSVTVVYCIISHNVTTSYLFNSALVQHEQSIATREPYSFD